MRRRFFYLTVSSDQIDIPDNEIWYTSSDNNVILPCDTSGFNTTIISNTYSNGKGVIIFADSITSIGEWAFCNCSDLTSVTIPNSVTSIEDYAFYYCSSLTSITCEATIPPIIYTLAFYNVSTSIPVYVPSESVDAYKSAQYWSKFTNIQAIS